MAQKPIARLGDVSDHGGVIITSASKTYVNGILVARVGDLHSCPIPGHGVTAITNGSGKFFCEGAVTAVVGSVCGCGASITTGSPNSFAPLDGGGGGGGPSDPRLILGIGRLGVNTLG